MFPVGLLLVRVRWRLSLLRRVVAVGLSDEWPVVSGVSRRRRDPWALVVAGRVVGWMWTGRWDGPWALEVAAMFRPIRAQWFGPVFVPMWWLDVEREVFITIMVRRRTVLGPVVVVMMWHWSVRSNADRHWRPWRRRPSPSVTITITITTVVRSIRLMMMMLVVVWRWSVLSGIPTDRRRGRPVTASTIAITATGLLCRSFEVRVGFPVSGHN
ncbi:hypothetical protein LINGRAHAP2_LOCUS37007 [Linum grandiflorum]